MWRLRVKNAKYYFQDDRIRLRLWEPKDTLDSYNDELDSYAMALVYEEVPLPAR